MRCFSCLLFILITYSIARADTVEPDIVGTFKTKLGDEKFSQELSLQCESASNCKLTTTAQFGQDKPTKNVQALGKVQPLGNLSQAAYALRYATAQQSAPIKKPEYSELMRRLQSYFSNNPSIKQCWDLNYPTPEYSLVCTFSGTSSEPPPVFLLFSLQTNCSEAFCKYVIYPMSRTN